MRLPAAVVAACCLVGTAYAQDGIPKSLTGAKGDPARGRAIVANRQVGLCLLCHSGPFPEERFQGNLAPGLEGAGKRWSEGQLRLRIVDSGRINPATIMPAYHVTERVGTGGLVGLIHPVARSIQVVNPHLTLEGLRLVYEHAAPGGEA